MDSTYSIQLDLKGDRLQSNDDNPLFRVDETSDLPIWAQLRNRFAYLIRTGFFKPGEQLPSVRRQYRSKGMTYRAARERMLSIIDELERKARKAEEEKSEYGIVQ